MNYALKIFLCLVTVQATPVFASEPEETEETKPDITQEAFLKSAETRFAEMDTDFDGVLTAKEIKAPGLALKRERDKKTFRKMDRSHDGYLTLSEYEDYQQESLRVTLEQQDADMDRQFARFDENGDGYLSQEEFKATMNETKSHFTTYLNSTGKLYNKLDIDDDGTVSEEEYVDKKGRFGKAANGEQLSHSFLVASNGRRLRPVVKQDPNGDKRITRYENERFQESFFAALDLDSDGVLSHAEQRDLHWRRYDDKTWTLYAERGLKFSETALK